MLVTLTALACRQARKASKSELLAYINDESNSLKQSQTVNDVCVQLEYRPPSLLISQELDQSTLSDTVLLKKLEAKYSNHHYFILKLSKKNKEVIRQLGNFDNYSSMLQLIAFNLKDYINLTALKDTIPVADYYFDQTYGMGDGNNILLDFNKSSIRDNKRFNINIHEFGLGIGNLIFSFNTRDLEGVPKLDYSSNY